jgi:uncharacterized protein YigA (DUF484 family)
MLTEITVPHPYSNQAISLGERQVLALRDKSRGLELKLREFIQFAEENDAIGDKLHKVALDLMHARSLEAVFQSLATESVGEFLDSAQHAACLGRSSARRCGRQCRNSPPSAPISKC